VTLAPEELKACCAAVYAKPAARWLLGESFHPGGAELTYRLVDALEVGPAHLVVDVASGPGTSAIRCARQTGCEVIGIDLSSESVAAANAGATEAGLAGRVRFVVGDAEALPLEDASVGGVLCECSLCVFPDKAAAVAELARVLRPGARLALSDVTAEPARLPSELRSISAWVACVADARPLEEIGALLASAGLRVEIEERHDAALVELLDRVEARLRAGRLLRSALPEELHGAVDRGLELVAAARAAVADGALGYGALVARKP